MTKHEKLRKLRPLRPTAFPTVATFDMGLQFDTLSGSGAGTHLGEVSGWPLWKIERLDAGEMGRILEKIGRGELSAADFSETDFQVLSSALSKNRRLDLNSVFAGIGNFPKTEEEEYLYVFADAEISPCDEIMFFGTEEELSAYFLERFPIYETWEEMDEEELDGYLEAIEESGDGLSYNYNRIFAEE